MNEQAEPEQQTEKAATDGAYRVLARKYRPQTFEDLVGQEPMVQTLRNAFDTGRIPQAWMLTGVRGVGKTTTARILARGLNYEIPGEVDKPTIHLEREGIHCRAIMEGRHVDVIEMDAASHTGIGDIREIIDSVRYRPATARYKVYIIDEVHMLSNAAFNGLLKTLEEPPEHVKFIFATTEIRKVPVTVLSRCQRFDLRRIEMPKLVGLLRRISDAEHVDVEDDALSLIARAGEGSARDSLSLLDQAIAHAEGRIEATSVRDMLGLADRARVIDLFGHLMGGQIAEALEELQSQYSCGADPVVVLTDLAEFTHLVTRLKIVPKASEEASLTEMERVRGREYSEKLSMRSLSRAWQVLLKGIAEVQAAPKPLAAADMVLVRLAYAADLPDPEEALKLLRSGALGVAPGGAVAIPSGDAPNGARGVPRSEAEPAPRPSLATVPGGRSPSQPSQQTAPEVRPQAVAQPAAMSQAQPKSERPAAVAQVPQQAPVAQAAKAPAVTLTSLQDCAALASQHRHIPLKVSIERQMRLVKFEPGRIEVQPTEDASANICGELAQKLTEWTGQRWNVVVSRTQGRPTIYEEREANQAQILADARANPLVATLLSEFPGAKVVDVRVQVEDDEDAEMDPDMIVPIDDDDDDDLS